MNWIAYWHRNATLDGIHDTGSESPLSWLACPATASRLAGSFANRSLMSSGQFLAPRSHASASGTMWSICTDAPTWLPRTNATVALVYGSCNVPVATAMGHRLIDTYVLSARS